MYRITLSGPISRIDSAIDALLLAGFDVIQAGMWATIEAIGDDIDAAGEAVRSLGWRLLSHRHADGAEAVWMTSDEAYAKCLAAAAGVN